MSDSIFSRDDRVDDNELPAELKGKTPDEIAAYYRKQNEILRRQIANPPPPPARESAPADDKIDVFGDADGSIKRAVDKRVREAVSATAGVAAPAIIASCRMTCRERHADFDKFAVEIEKRMKGTAVEWQMNPDNWELMYRLVKGEQADTLIEAARTEEREKIKNPNPVERGNAPGEKPPKPRELTDEERLVAKKFDMPVEAYTKAAERYDQTEGLLPFTYDSKKPRKKAS